MLLLRGIHGHAKIMIDKIDTVTVEQIYGFLDHEVFTNPISIMPDTHAGAGAVIGFTMEMTDKIIPNVIGVDIGCGMLSGNFGKGLFAHGLSRKDFDEQVRDIIPFGYHVHDKHALDLKRSKMWNEMTGAVRNFTMKYNERTGKSYNFPEINEKWLQKKSDDIGIDYQRTVNSIGTLGGGNHFIEVGVDSNNDYWVTIHSGSRQFGLKAAVYNQRKAGKGVLAYLEGEDMFNYLIDMVVAQQYAATNRNYMAYFIWSLLDRAAATETIETVHNYINFNDFIIRKGAISAYKNEKMIIPFNMEDGTLICKGKSNAEWNYSAPHGAGRVGSRKWAKKNLSKRDAEKSMKEKDIYFSVLPLDETKGAYKDSQIIEDSIGPTAEIIDKIKPVLNMKEK